MSAQSFQRDLERFQSDLLQRAEGVFAGATAKVRTSIIEGSAATGAPGQPVDIGALRGSWQTTFPERYLSRTTTGLEYARAVEEGQQPPYTTASGKLVEPRPMQLRSPVGGLHSVKLTRAGIQALVDETVREVVGP